MAIDDPQTGASPPAFRLPHYLAYLTLCLIWGSTWMAIRVLVHDVPPLWSAGVRFTIAAALLLLVAAVRGLQPPQGSRQWRAVFVLGLTMIAFPYGLLFWAERFVTSSMTAVLYTTLPLCVAALTPWMSKHSVPRSAILSMVVGVGGIAVLFGQGLTASRGTLFGGVAILLGVVSNAFSILFAKREISGMDPVVSTGWQFLVGATALLAGSLAMERGRASDWTTHALIALLFLAIAGSAVAFATYYWLLRHMQPYQISTISLAIPIIAILEGSLVLQEPISPLMLGASLVVLAAVAGVLRAQAGEPAPITLSEG
jgi:drug/metabolite transporter (DMT)-like permease